MNTNLTGYEVKVKVDMKENIFWSMIETVRNLVDLVLHVVLPGVVSLHLITSSKTSFMRLKLNIQFHIFPVKFTSGAYVSSHISRDLFFYACAYNIVHVYFDMFSY